MLFQELALLFEELDEDGDGQVSFNEFLHGLFAAKDLQQSDVEPEWEQPQQSTPYNQAPSANFTAKVRVCMQYSVYLHQMITFPFTIHPSLYLRPNYLSNAFVVVPSDDWPSQTEVVKFECKYIKLYCTCIYGLLEASKFP